MRKRTLFDRILHFFDKFEDHVRLRLSRHPIFYAIVGGIGIVLFWKGVWETAEYFDFLHGPGSIIASLVILLATGLFVSYFIGDTIIISGLRGEKKTIDKQEHEIFNEEQEIARLGKEMKRMHKELHDISGTPMEEAEKENSSEKKSEGR